MALKIGLFDSGIGGLSIAKKIWERFGEADIYYLADRLHAPYGELSEDEITDRVKWCGHELFKQNVDLIVVACNTATAAGIEILRKNLPIPVIGVEPDLHFYKRSNIEVRPEEICVMCTSYTLKSSKFKHLQARRDPENKLHYKGMKNLARLIEKCFWEFNQREENEKLIINDVQSVLQKNEFKYIVLGCTHYELISPLLEKTTGAKAIGVATAIANRCVELFEELKNYTVRNADSCGKFFFFDSITCVWEQKKFQEFLSWPRD